MLTVVFFTFVFGLIEIARALYMWNTLPVVMQRAARAAAVTDPQNAAAMAQLTRSAVLRGSAPAGSIPTMPLGEPITSAHVNIDYLDANQAPLAAGALPACPHQHYINCIDNFGGAIPGRPACIRFVRARLCAPGGGAVCGAVTYQPLLPLVPLPITFPPFTVVLKAETLGYLPGTAATCNVATATN